MLKLEHVGIRGKLQCWVESYMSNITFCVRVGHSLTSVADVVSDVPQGSVLGPLVFLIYIADLPHVWSSLVLSYEDQIFFQSCQLLQQDLNVLSLQGQKWLLPLNVDKCVIVYLARNNQHNRYFLNNIQLKPLDVGITIIITEYLIF